MDIKLPFLKQPVGAGDLTKAALSSLGIEQKPGDCGCKKRQQLMNGLQFVPRTAAAHAIPAPAMISTSERQPATWTKPPEIPRGWARVDERGVWDGPVMFRHEAGKVMIWEIIAGEYRRSKSFCSGCGSLAMGQWRRLTNA